MAVDRSALHEEQHARLLDGLAASIREKGLARSQVSDIVRHARASRRTFYNHFPDKDSCFVELAEVISRGAMARVADAIDPDAAIPAQIDAAVDAYLDLLESEPELTLTFFSPGLSADVVRAQQEGMESYAQLIASVVEADARRDHRVAQIPRTRAYVLISGMAKTIERALEVGDDLSAAGEEIKAVFKLVLTAPDDPSGS